MPKTIDELYNQSAGNYCVVPKTKNSFNYYLYGNWNGRNTYRLINYTIDNYIIKGEFTETYTGIIWDKGCIEKEEFLRYYEPEATGMEAFIGEATGADGINNDNLWENMKPIVPGLIIATLFALGIVVVEKLVNRSSKGKA